MRKTKMKITRFQPQTVPASSKTVAPNSRPLPARFSLSNTHGFWELTFYGRCATVPQHQALFFVAWLLANPPARPLDAAELAATVLDLFGQHPDFLHSNLLSLSNTANHRAILSLTHRRIQSLHVALADPAQSEPIRAELIREIDAIGGLERTLLNEFSATQAATAQFLTYIIYDLYLTLSQASTPQGDPHPLLRHFSRHLLLYLIMPSLRVSRSAFAPMFTYEPPPQLRWSPLPDFAA